MPLTGAAGPVTAVNRNGTAVGSGVLWENGSNTATPLAGGGLPMAINDSEVVAGRFIDPKAGVHEPGRWTSATGWTMIDNPAPRAQVNDINNAGMAVGSIHDQEDDATLWP